MPLRTGRRLPAASILAASLAAAALLLAVTACGGDDQPEVASAATGGPGATTPSPTAGVVERFVETRRQYVACMRDNGFDLPDPGPKGQIDTASLGLPKTDKKLLAAAEKCKEFMLPVPEELEEKGPPLTAEQIANVRRYAACMRANGVPEFRDPEPDGYFSDRGGVPTSEQAAAASFRAGQICEPVLAGRPPTTPNPAATGQG